MLPLLVMPTVLPVMMIVLIVLSGSLEDLPGAIT
jgi:hypothetical protein